MDMGSKLKTCSPDARVTESNESYILQTNVFTGGKGDRDQRIFLWFDPTKAYDKYYVLWNMYQTMEVLPSKLHSIFSYRKVNKTTTCQWQ